MENLNSGDRFSTVRSIVGTDYSDMDIIRALHLANNDATAAINIIFDTPDFGKRLSKKNHGASCIFSSSTDVAQHEIEGMEDCYKLSSVSVPDFDCRTIEGGEDTVYSEKNRSEWWLLGRGDIPGLSTCKGRKLKIGDEVDFIFPQQKIESSPPPGRVFGRGRRLAICSDIVRFSTKDNGEIGRIPKEWARCLLPLVRDKKVRIEGTCKYAPQLLSIMDTVVLAVRVYLYSPTFLKRHQVSLLKSINHSNEESTFHPLPFLFNLLGITPFIKAEFTPFNLFTRKRPLDSNDNIDPLSSVGDSICKMQHGISDKSKDGETISDNDLDFIVGTADSSDLQEMDPPSGLLCDLRPYQKQALFWMTQLEQGRCLDDPSKTLHPCWSAYHLADRKKLLYLNSFSGDATTEFPSTLEMARGGVLADAMGLGKTIMTIALLLSRTGKGGSSANKPISEAYVECTDVISKVIKQETSYASGGTLIVCPMTLLGQWKAEIEAHTDCGSLSPYIHYGQSRSKDTQSLAQNDVVITTYGVLAAEFSAESTDSGGLCGIHWFRVVLDEAHVIKSSKSQISLAAAALIADCRWCLTGTPIQNNLEDIYSLLRFLKVEPWGNWAWWNKLVQKPFEEGDDRGLKLVQSILKPIMLRRTKSTTDRNGRPIVVLPPAEIKVVYCQQTEAEKDFYESLFKRSKVKFDQFVEQGRVLHNYASILELLLRLRQCCDHPFLVMSRGDTQDFTDLNKLAKKFLKGTESGSVKGGNDVPSRAYVKEVVDELRKGEEGECPICLEAFEDAVLTPCAHRMCRECLLGSLRNLSSGFCPVCRKSINRQDLITAPTGSRFRIDVENNWIESSKVSVLLSELESLRSSGSKSIVFSQWTAFLDLLQIPLSRNNITFLRLDGTLSQQKREKVLKKFSEEAGIMVLLMSLKAGGVGINLTAASNAFVLDPWWNPAVEEQAVMRIHRIGQTKPVMIKRFIVKGTVEERMEIVQARKQRMISGALTDEEVRTARIEELKMLFT